ncbi:MAG: hypothetical protein ACRENZ_03195 [Thermodesulfobacteriota bacterium]
MPLSEKARIEVYLPDLPKKTYQNLLNSLDQEFTYTFSGCTILRGLEGSYLSRLGQKMQDRVTLIYADTPFAFDNNLESISRYADELRNAVFRALEEETILIVAFKVYHSG